MHAQTIGRNSLGRTGRPRESLSIRRCSRKTAPCKLVSLQVGDATTGAVRRLVEQFGLCHMPHGIEICSLTQPYSRKMGNQDACGQCELGPARGLQTGDQIVWSLRPALVRANAGGKTTQPTATVEYP